MTSLNYPSSLYMLFKWIYSLGFLVGYPYFSMFSYVSFFLAFFFNIS